MNVTGAQHRLGGQGARAVRAPSRRAPQAPGLRRAFLPSIPVGLRKPVLKSLLCSQATSVPIPDLHEMCMKSLASLGYSTEEAQTLTEVRS